MFEQVAETHRCDNPKISCVRNFIKQSLALGYDFSRMREFEDRKDGLPKPEVYLRVDVDFSLQKTHTLIDLLGDHGVHGTFFLRTRAREYNLLSAEGLAVVDRIRAAGHEIGLHTELQEISAGREKVAAEFLKEDLTLLRDFLDLTIVGSAAHGSGSATNNLDFWSTQSNESFGLSYEAYEKSEKFDLFHSARYISDSNWDQWKTFSSGKISPADARGPCEHLLDRPRTIHLLIHPDTY